MTATLPPSTIEMIKDLEGDACRAGASVGEGASYTTVALGLLVRLGLPRGKLVRLGLGRFSLWRGEGGLPHVPKSRLDLRLRRLLELVLIGPTAGSA